MRGLLVLALIVFSTAAYAQEKPAGGLLRQGYTIVWVPMTDFFYLQKSGSTYLCKFPTDSSKTLAIATAATRSSACLPVTE